MYTDQEIAQLTGTTTANVYKEKGHYAREIGKKFTVAIQQASDLKAKSSSSSTTPRAITTTTTSMTNNLGVEFEHNQYVVAPPLNQEQLRILYKAFDEGKDPTQIIAETGLNPEVVEIEYRRYFRLKRRVPPQIAIAILNSIPASSPALEGIRKKFIETKELDLKELENALHTNNYYQMINGFSILADTFLLDTNTPLLSSVSRPLCNDCKLPVPGVIFKNEKFIAERLANSSLLCPQCRKLRGF